jgi:hypothetical protein
MLKAWEKSNFTNVLQRDILEDEVASDRFGSYSLLQFGGIIIISSSISLSHYIKRDLSWKRLRFNRLRIVWRFLLQIMRESFVLVLQVRLWIFFIQGIGAKVCVCSNKEPSKGDLATSMHGLYSPLSIHLIQ